MRAHLYQVIADEAGNIQPGTQVRLLAPDADPADAVSLDAQVYVSKTGTATVGTMFVSETGVVDVWLDVPQYVMIGLTPPGGTEYFIDNVLAAAPASGTGGGGATVFVQPDEPPNAALGTLWYDTDEVC